MAPRPSKNRLRQRPTGRRRSLTLTCHCALVGGGCATLPEALRWDAERAVEFARRVFPGDDFGEFDDFVVVEDAADAGEEVVVDVAVREGDGIGVRERDALPLVEEFALAVSVEREQLFL
jgi:hypothetical protein